MDYDFILYYDVCASCKNTVLGIAKNIALQELGEGMLDERYVYALPMWMEEAKEIGAKMPFIYQISTGDTLPLSNDDENLSEKIRTFLTK